MDAKLKSKTHLLNTFFARLASKFSKSANMLKIKFVGKNHEWYQKTQNFTLILNPLKKCLKNVPKNSYKQNKFDEYS